MDECHPAKLRLQNRESKAALLARRSNESRKVWRAERGIAALQRCLTQCGFLFLWDRLRCATDFPSFRGQTYREVAEYSALPMYTYRGRPGSASKTYLR